MMNQTRFIVKTETASVGAGAKWGEVYGYAVPGAKASEVGVAGVTLGGGFAARYGFVCDNVRNFEIVLGNGTLTNANATQNPNLFKGLTGGAGNLGLVTQFDFAVFPSGDLWGGRVTYDYSAVQKTSQPMIDWIEKANLDLCLSLIQFWGYNAATDQTFTANAYQYTGNAPEKPYYESSDPSITQTTFPHPLSISPLIRAVRLPKVEQISVSIPCTTSHPRLILPITYATFTPG